MVVDVSRDRRVCLGEHALAGNAETRGQQARLRSVTERLLDKELLQGFADVTGGEFVMNRLSGVAFDALR
jgi:hypothetical protein